MHYAPCVDHLSGAQFLATIISKGLRSMANPLNATRPDKFSQFHIQGANHLLSAMAGGSNHLIKDLDVSS